MNKYLHMILGTIQRYEDIYSQFEAIRDNEVMAFEEKKIEVEILYKEAAKRVNDEILNNLSSEDVL